MQILSYPVQNCLDACIFNSQFNIQYLSASCAQHNRAKLPHAALSKGNQIMGECGGGARGAGRNHDDIIRRTDHIEPIRSRINSN